MTFTDRLALPARTVESRAARLHQPADSAGTAKVAVAAGTGRTLASVYRPAVLKIAELARGLDVVAQRAAAGSDRACQHVAHGGGQALGAHAPDRGGQALGRQPGL